MGKTWKDKPKKYGRSHIPPPGHVHEDKRRKPRSQEKQDVRFEDGYMFKNGSTVPEGNTFSE